MEEEELDSSRVASAGGSCPRHITARRRDGGVGEVMLARVGMDTSIQLSERKDGVGVKREVDLVDAVLKYLYVISS